MPAAHMVRAISVAMALAIVIGTGVAWGKIRSFESGINHINPIALGEGEKFWKDGERHKLALKDTDVYDNGVVHLRYGPA